MILKDPEIGGAWEWHQDYGYWYNFGCLQPLMASAMIAVDQATKENGCLQVLMGSHHLGRIDHTLTGDQAGADKERVDIALQRFDRIHVELNPGDVILFHGTLLQRSDQNSSKNARWAMICCYNAARNNPFKDSITIEETMIKNRNLGIFLFKIFSVDINLHKIFPGTLHPKLLFGHRRASIVDHQEKLIQNHE